MKKIITFFLVVLASLVCDAFDDYKSAFTQGITFVKAGNHKEAVKAFEKAEKKAKSSEEIFSSSMAAGHSLQAMCKYAEAEASFRKILNTEDLASPAQASEAWFNIGYLLWNQKKFPAALEAFSNGGLTGSGSDMEGASIYWEGRVCMELKKMDDAQKAYKRVISSEKYHVNCKLDAYAALAKYAATSGDFTEAYRQLDEAAKIPSDTKGISTYYYTGVTRTRAQILDTEKKYKEAIAEYKKVIADSKAPKPWQADALNQMAGIYFYQLKDTLKAKEYIEKSAAIKAEWGYDKNLYERINKEFETK